MEMDVDVNTKEVNGVAKEGGWGWIVVIAVSYCFGILYGMVNNYALIYNELTIVYNTTQNNVLYAAWTGSLSYAMQCGLCVFGSVLVDFFNPRVIGVIGGLVSSFSMLLSAQVKEIQFYLLTYGVMLAIGQALLLASTLAILPHYFNKKLSMANGITNCLAAACCSIMPFLFYEIIEKYLLQGGFYFLSLLNLIAAMLCLTYKTVLPRSKLDLRMRIKQSLGFEVLKKKKFMIWCAATFFGVVGYLIPIVVIDHHSEKAFPEGYHVYLNIGFGAASGFSALFFGILGDYTHFNHAHYHTVAYLVYGIVQILLPFAQSFEALLVMIIILGIGDGVILCFIVPIACDLVKSAKLSNQATGYYHLIMTPGAMFGPLLAGWLYEIFNTYSMSFYVGGVSCIICAVVILSIEVIPDDVISENSSRDRVDHKNSKDHVYSNQLINQSNSC